MCVVLLFQNIFIDTEDRHTVKYIMVKFSALECDMCTHPSYQTWDTASSLAVCVCPVGVGEEFFSPNKTGKDTGQLISAPSSFSGWCWDKRGPFLSVNRLGPSRPSFRPPAESLRPGCLLIACVLAVTYREPPSMVGAVAEFLPYENRDFSRPH